MRDLFEFAGLVLTFPVVAFHYNPIASFVVASVFVSLAVVIAVLSVRGD